MHNFLCWPGGVNWQEQCIVQLNRGGTVESRSLYSQSRPRHRDYSPGTAPRSPINDQLITTDPQKDICESDIIG
jgi:hypothetical protein